MSLICLLNCQDYLLLSFGFAILGIVRGLISLLLLSSSFLLINSAGYEKKYVIDKFERLSWEVFPETAEKCQQLTDKHWKISNTLTEPLLLIAPYKEENFALGVSLKFEVSSSNRAGSNRAGIFFNLQDDLEEKGRPTFLTLEVDDRFNFSYSAFRDGARQELETFSFKPDVKGKSAIELTFLKIGDTEQVMIAGEKHTLEHSISLPTGTFGFIFYPGAGVLLSDFRFIRFEKKYSPLEGVDIEKLWPRKQAKE